MNLCSLPAGKWCLSHSLRKNRLLCGMLPFVGKHLHAFFSLAYVDIQCLQFVSLN